MIQVAFLRIARVVKWQTRTFEGRMPKGVGVQVPPPSTARNVLHFRYFLTARNRFEFFRASGSQ